MRAIYTTCTDIVIGISMLCTEYAQNGAVWELANETANQGALLATERSKTGSIAMLGDPGDYQKRKNPLGPIIPLGGHPS